MQGGLGAPDSLSPFNFADLGHGRDLARGQVPVTGFVDEVAIVAKARRSRGIAVPVTPTTW